MIDGLRPAYSTQERKLRHLLAGSGERWSVGMAFASEFVPPSSMYDALSGINDHHLMVILEPRIEINGNPHEDF
jgi:hypothetical protein